MSPARSERLCQQYLTVFRRDSDDAYFDFCDRRPSTRALVLNRSPHRLYVMNKRYKQQLERDLERYRALLKLMADQQARTALKQLIKETTDRINDINNRKQLSPS